MKVATTAVGVEGALDVPVNEALVVVERHHLLSTVGMDPHLDGCWLAILDPLFGLTFFISGMWQSFRLSSQYRPTTH
jgi:hypothetical protein